MRATPASSTKILNGAGGGSSDGIDQRHQAVCAVNAASARSTSARLEPLPQERLAALRGQVVEREAAGDRAERRHGGVVQQPVLVCASP